jgi:hypothetical protein
MGFRFQAFDFYLAHPFDSRFRLRGWGEKLEKKFGVSVLNPFYDSDEQVDIIAIDAGRQERYTVPDDIIVDGDLYCIQSTKATIANVTGELSYGTIMEMVYTKLYGHECYTIVTNGHEKHPWITRHSTRVFITYEEFEEWLKTSEYVK